MEKWYQSLTMGNIVRTRFGVLCQVFESLFKYKTVDVRWIVLYL